MEEGEIEIDENDNDKKNNINNNNSLNINEKINEKTLLNKRKRPKKINKKQNTKKDENQIIKDGLSISSLNIFSTSLISIYKYKQIKFKTNQKLFKKGKQKIPIEEQENKFYNLRYYLFSQFDKGIQMDKESWYSVTPEEISIYISNIIKDSNNYSIIDAFCGCGGNTIFFSKKFKKVYANDLYEDKIKMTINNLKIYNCDNNVIFSCQDFLNFNEKSDFIFLSPPWGGIEYKNDDNFMLKKWIQPDIEEIIKHSLKLSQNLIFYLPRCTKINELTEYIYKYDKKFIDDNEKNIYLDVQYLISANKIKALLVLYGEKFNNIQIKDIRKYFKENYKIKGNNKDIKIIISIAKILGANKFLNYCEKFNQNFLQGNLNDKVNENIILNYLKNNMTKEELEELENEIKSKEMNQINTNNKIIINEETKTYNITKILTENEFSSLLNYE